MAVSRTLSKNSPQNYQYIKITINGKLPAYHVSKGVAFDAKGALIEYCSGLDKNYSSINLHELDKEKAKSFASMNKNTPIQFYFSEDQITTTLPKYMNSNLVIFFKKYKPEYKKHYCCVNFTYEIAYGRDVIKKDNDVTLDIGDQTLENTTYEENISPGKIVTMYKETDTHQYINGHHAIYIGQQHYLSLFNDDGPLMIASLESMKKAFQSETTIVFDKRMGSKNMKYLEKSPGLSLFAKPNRSNANDSVQSVTKLQAGSPR